MRHLPLVMWSANLLNSIVDTSVSINSIQKARNSVSADVSPHLLTAHCCLQLWPGLGFCFLICCCLWHLQQGCEAVLWCTNGNGIRFGIFMQIMSEKTLKGDEGMIN